MIAWDMTSTIPPLLSAWLAAHNAHDAAAFAACFTDDATVRDEGRAHHGRPAIRAWFEEVSRRYRAVLAVTDVTEIAGEFVLTGSISGLFEGSPVRLRYVLATEDDKIVALRIVP
jgi:uncharacterized protein (TIGR02246 family)